LHYLRAIYGENLNYDAIKIQTGGIKEKLGISPQAVGSDIFLRKNWGTVIVSEDLSLTTAGLRLLGHEACHVWQFQHRGAGYIGDSLITQLFDALGRKLGLTLSDGYDVLPALNANTKYEQCNVEQQAVIAELIGVLCCGHESAGLVGDTLHPHTISAECAHRPSVQHSRLTCRAFNQLTGFELTADQFVLVRNAHALLTGSEQME